MFDSLLLRQYKIKHKRFNIMKIQFLPSSSQNLANSSLSYEKQKE